MTVKLKDFNETTRFSMAGIVMGFITIIIQAISMKWSLNLDSILVSFQGLIFGLLGVSIATYRTNPRCPVCGNVNVVHTDCNIDGDISNNDVEIINDDNIPIDD